MFALPFPLYYNAATNPMDTAPTRPSKFKSLLEGALYFVSAFVLALFIQTYIARPFIVNGQSMYPTFKNGEYLIVDEISYRFDEPKRGDVVVFKAPPTPDKYFIKRIIGLPGETVIGKNGTVTIINKQYPNGFSLDESFLESLQTGTFEFVVPTDAYFVMGDNRAGSFDSRSWGAMPKENLRGRALVRLLPFSRIDFLPGAVSFEQ